MYLINSTGNKKQERNGSIHSPTEPPPGKSDQQLKPEKTVTLQPCDHNSMELDTSRSCAATKSCDITGATTIIDEQNSFICKVKPNLFF